MIDVSEIKLIDLVPSPMKNDSTIRAAAEAIDQQLHATTALIPRLAIVHHIDTLPETWVDQLAYQFHVDFYDPSLPVERKRELVHHSLAWHKRKGTPSAVEEVVSIAFSDAEVTEWWEYGGTPGYFRVSTESEVTDADALNELIRSIHSVKNVRSWLDGMIIERTKELSLRIGGVVQQVKVRTILPEGGA